MIAAQDPRGMTDEELAAHQAAQKRLADSYRALAERHAKAAQDALDELLRRRLL